MKRNILILLAAFQFTVCAPVSVCAQENKSQIEKVDGQKPQQDVQRPSNDNELQAITINVSNSTVHIKNAAHAIAEVYNIAGGKVKTLRIDSDDKTFDMSYLPKGCYMFKIGKTVRKVYLK